MTQREELVRSDPADQSPTHWLPRRAAELHPGRHQERAFLPRPAEPRRIDGEGQPELRMVGSDDLLMRAQMAGLRFEQKDGDALEQQVPHHALLPRPS